MMEHLFRICLLITIIMVNVYAFLVSYSIKNYILMIIHLIVFALIPFFYFWGHWIAAELQEQ